MRAALDCVDALRPQSTADGGCAQCSSWREISARKGCKSLMSLNDCACAVRADEASTEAAARLVQQLAEHGRERGPQLGREALHDRAAGRAPAGRRQEVHDAPAQLARGLQLRPWDRM
jgi:hypothetical protein